MTTVFSSVSQNVPVSVKGGELLHLPVKPVNLSGVPRCVITVGAQ